MKIQVGFGEIHFDARWISLEIFHKCMCGAGATTTAQLRRICDACGCNNAGAYSYDKSYMDEAK